MATLTDTEITRLSEQAESWIKQSDYVHDSPQVGREIMALIAYCRKLEAVAEAARELLSPLPGIMDINFAMGQLDPKRAALTAALAHLDADGVK